MAIFVGHFWLQRPLRSAGEHRARHLPVASRSDSAGSILETIMFIVMSIRFHCNPSLGTAWTSLNSIELDPTIRLRACCKRAPLFAYKRPMNRPDPSTGHRPT